MQCQDVFADAHLRLFAPWEGPQRIFSRGYEYPYRPPSIWVLYRHLHKRSKQKALYNCYLVVNSLEHMKQQ